MNIKKHIPNFITLLNLLCGCIAIVYASNSNYLYAFIFVSLGIFLDFFDGFFARIFNVSGALGLQLDSLADMVTSGVVPGFVMYLMFNNDQIGVQNSFLPYFGFIITLGACYRLAKFNIDTRQSDSFIGLPTPANCLFILSLPLIKITYPDSFLSEVLQNQYVLGSITLLSAWLMNAELPLFSLKIKKFDFSKYFLQIFFVLISIALLLIFKALGLALVIIFYVLLSIIMNFVKQKNV